MTAATKYNASGLSSEGTLEILPKFWRSGTVGIIYCHGAGGDGCLEPWTLTVDQVNMRRVVDAVVDAGYPVLSCHLGGDTWGNASAVTKVGTAVTYLESLGITRIGFIGQSMGSLPALNWAAQNRAKTAFVFMSMGVADLNDIFGNGSYTASINAAYGGAYSNATYGATYNPTVNAASKFSGMPFLAMGGSSDTTCPPAKTTALTAAIGSSGTYTQVSGGHAWTTVANYSTADVVAFMRANP